MSAISTAVRGLCVVLEPGALQGDVRSLPAPFGDCALWSSSECGGRRRNEDRVGAWCAADNALLVLADGMGGHPEGDAAADLVVRTLGERFSAQVGAGMRDPARFLEDAFGQAQRSLLAYGRGLEAADQPRTTLIAAVVHRGRLWWAHCGDSRLYLVRDGRLAACTRDHSFAQRALMRPPGVNPAAHVSRHVLYSCIGSPGAPQIDAAGPWVLEPGDRWLLCSDGLWESLADADIVAALSDADLPSSLAALVARALTAGGEQSDNVTLLAMNWGRSVPAQVLA